MFEQFTIVVNDGLWPCLKNYANWLMNDGAFLGACVLVLPIFGRIINIFIKAFRG